MMSARDPVEGHQEDSVILGTRQSEMGGVSFREKARKISPKERERRLGSSRKRRGTVMAGS